MRFVFVLLGILSITWAGEASAKKCRRVDGKKQVFVKSSTPVRRGPGLNYPVVLFLERGRCVPLNDTSEDLSWVMVDAKGSLGWVPLDRLSKRGQELIAKGKGKPAPKVEKKKRKKRKKLKKGYVRVIESAKIYQEPKKSSKEVGSLEEPMQVLPLTATSDRVWVQITFGDEQVGWVLDRTLKGKALNKLPQIEPMAEDPPPPPPPDPDFEPSPELPSSEFSIGRSVERPTRKGDSITVIGQVFGAALAPVHSLRSDGALPELTYDLTALAAGGGAEIQIADLGPMALRVGYQFGFLTGLKAEDNEAIALSGTQHDVVARVGIDFQVGTLIIRPELGYALGLFQFDERLPTGEGQNERRFISSTTQSGVAGVQLEWFLTPSFALEVDGAAQVGFTFEYPEEVRLGTPDLMIGGLASIGGQFLVGDNVGVVVKYSANYRKTNFTGPSALHQSIVNSTLTDFSHGLLVGAMFFWSP